MAESYEDARLSGNGVDYRRQPRALWLHWRERVAIHVFRGARPSPTAPFDTAPRTDDSPHRVPTGVLERGILYAPDYVINAGGLINVYVELHGHDRTGALALTREICSRLRKVFAVARDVGSPTSVAADRIVEQRLAQGRRERITSDASDSDLSGYPATPITGAMTPSH